MTFFQVFISAYNVSDLVSQDSLEEFVTQAEGDSIWDYRSDTIQIQFQRNLFAQLGISSIAELRKKTVEIYDASTKIFYGAIIESSYDYKSKIINCEIASIGWIVSKLNAGYDYPEYYLRGSKFINTKDRYFRALISTSGGNTLQEIAERQVNIQNYNLARAGYDLKIKGSLVNNLDISFYKSFIESTNPFPLTQTVGMGTGSVNQEREIPLAYFVYRDSIQGNNVLRHYYALYRIDAYYYLAWEIENGSLKQFPVYSAAPRGDNFMLNSQTRDSNNNMIYWETAVVNDYGKKSVIDRQINYALIGEESLSDNSEQYIEYYGVIKIGTKIIAIIELKKVKRSDLTGRGKTVFDIQNTGVSPVVAYEISDLDVFLFEYKNATCGKVLKDFAILTDTIVYFTPEGSLVFQNRLASEQVSLSSSSLLKYTEHTIDYSNISFEMPENIYVDKVLNLSGQYKAYYKELISEGDYIKTIIETPKYLFPFKSPMLGQLMIDEKDCGIIKKMRYTKNTIELTTEKRL